MINEIVKLVLMKVLFSRRFVTASCIGFAVIILVLRSIMSELEPASRLHFEIKSTWNDFSIDHPSTHLTLSSDVDHGMVIEINAPFFNDPPNPGGQPGLPFQGLWEHEVVEAFFLNDKNQYLEAEFCPHGQHLVLLLNGFRKPFKDMLNLTYNAAIHGNTWKGKAVIPWDYFPHGITRFNAYAIHGSATWRVYEALYPVPKEKFSSPDFHRLEYFKNVDFKRIFPKTYQADQVSSLWKDIA